MLEVKLKPVRSPKKKFRIMFDWSAEELKVNEGYHLEDGEYDSVDEAVRCAVGLDRAVPFIIVKVYWTPK